MNRHFTFGLLLGATFWMLLPGCGSEPSPSHQPTMLDTLKQYLAEMKAERDNYELVSQIAIAIKIKDAKDLEVFPDGYYSMINVEHPEEDIDDLRGKDSIVLDADSLKLSVDYPLDPPATFWLYAEDQRGFTLKQLVLDISKTYHLIYSEEEETANTKTLPIDARGTSANRNATDGKYGISGHDIGDLALSEIYIFRDRRDGTYFVEFWVNS